MEKKRALVWWKLILWQNQIMESKTGFHKKKKLEINKFESSSVK